MAAPLTVLAVRWAKVWTPAGVIPGLFEAVAFPLLLLAPFCWVSGAAFGSLCSLAPAGRLYLLESAGALAAGLAATFVVAGRWPAFPVLAVSGAAVCALALRMARRFEAAAAGVLCVMLALAAGRLDPAASRPGFGALRFTEQKEGRYGHLAVASLPGAKVLFFNGAAVVSFPDAAAEEEAMHWPLLAHGKPKSALVLGAAALPALAQALKHPVGAVELVEADAEAVDMIRRNLDGAALKALLDPRVKLVIADPREYLRSRSRAYDVILQSNAEPLNAAGNRFFTTEFFAEARRALAPRGVLALSLPSSENYLSPETAYVNASVFNSLTAVFASSCTIIPGSRMALLAGRDEVSLDPERLAARFAARRIKNTAVTPPAFPYYLMPERREAVARRLSGLRRVPANEDLRPIAYFHTWRVWLVKFVSPGHLLGLIAAAVTACWGLARLWGLRKSLLGSWESLAVFCLGFAGIGVEIALLLAFQAVSGALYWEMGLLLAAFMAGLGLGALIGNLKPFTPLWSARALRLLLAAMGLAALALARNLPGLAGMDPRVAERVFPVLLAFTGFLVGWSFPLACRTGSAADSPQAVYAADLWGSALGAFLTAAFLVPLGGMQESLLVAAAAVLPAALSGFRR
ncbi:MAG: hypothetical protein HY748_08565 [Elusimicrobia bacterium]|nr:hypothetical protein [Elusimicrobiota bacterium]